MAVAVEDIWTVTPSSTYRVQLRADLDERLGLSVDYVGTIDGAWTAQSAQLAFEVDQRMQSAIAASLLATAPRPVVVARALDRGLTPRPATKSTMELTVAAGSGAILPVGTVLRVREGTVYYVDTEAGSVTVQLTSSTWTVIENLNDGELVGVSDTVIVESDTAGQVYVSAEITLAPSPPISGITSLTGDTMRTTGRAAESLPELRARLGAAKAQVGGSPAGIVAAVRDLDWVVAVGLTTTPGYIRVTVAPEPPTAADELELGETIYGASADLTAGTESVVVEGADGQDVTVYYDVGGTQAVTVAFTVTPAAGVTAAEAREVGRAALDEVFAGLGPGSTLLYLRALGALNQPGIVAATLTLDGGTADVTPDTAADTLVAVYA